VRALDPEFKRFLIDSYAGVLCKQGLELLYRDHGAEVRFTDQSRAQYRTDKELEIIESEVAAMAQRLSRELVDELQSHGFSTPEDFVTKKTLLKAMVNGYHKRLIDKLKSH
jgi:hypothetical protein